MRKAEPRQDNYSSLSVNKFFERFNKSIYIIAEIGTNHNGDLSLAKQMVFEAAKTGVDAVKFQLYKAEKFISRTVPVFKRAKSLGYKTQFERFKALELNHDQMMELYKLSKECGLDFLCTPFDEDSVDFLEPLVPAYKIASGDLINILLLRHVASKNKPVILSTGQAELEEIDRAIGVFPMDKIVLLHCVSSYPTPDEETNLRSISFLMNRYDDVPVGYSDHTVGYLACIGAVALGACIVEKHFTLDKSQGFGDHSLSADPKDMQNLVKEIRRLEKMLGEVKKTCQPCEMESKRQLRRSLHVNRALKAGTILKEEMISPLISQKGVNADKIDEVIGRCIIRDMEIGSEITFDDLI